MPCGRLPTAASAALYSSATSSRATRQLVATAAHMPHSPHPAATAAASAQVPLPATKTYVYSGPGAGSRSVLSTLHSLREALVPEVKVATLGTAELLAGGWQDGCLLLVMPGGADLPYCKHLNGRGNDLIREYVESGGAYLGCCAGAYYACSHVEFEPGTRLEVVGDRELSFFPGKAAGSIYKGFCYESEDGAVAAPLHFRNLDAGNTNSGSGSGSPSGRQKQTSLVGQSAWGLEVVVPADAPGAVAPQADGVATSTTGNSSSSSSSSSSLGGWEECLDYVNGGPGFVLRDGSSVSQVLEQQAQQEQQEQQERQERQQVLAVPGALPLEGVELLATYPEHGNTAAALLCHVGCNGGRAVLCGSHPELHPAWLAGRAPPLHGSAHSSPPGRGRAQQPGAPSRSSIHQNSNSSSNGSGSDGSRGAHPAAGLPSMPRVDTLSNRAAAASAVAAAHSATGSEHVDRLQAALMAGQQQRWRYWRSLLVAAGLAPWLQPWER